MKVFIARQPIFDQRQRVTAYELLFRSSEESIFHHTEGDYASQYVIGQSLHAFGFSELMHGKKAFISFTRSLLVQQAAMLLPPDKVVVQIAGKVELDDDLLQACQALKDGGYLLALGDFAIHEGYEPLIALADIIRVDFQTTTGDQRRAVAGQLLPRRIKLLAEKVETQEDFKDGIRSAYEFFQGYFFCKPEIVVRNDIPANKLNYLRFLREINQPNLDLDRLEQIIKQDVSLSVKLLRYINSAWFGLSRRVTSLRHALVLLGSNVVRQWASLVTITGLGDDKSTELVATCLLRGSFCERLARLLQVKGRESDLFLVGLFSSLDTLIGRPLDELLNEVAVPGEVREALLGTPNHLNQVFRLALAYERGEWQTVKALSELLAVDEDQLPDMYEQSVAWVHQVMSTG